MNQIGEGPLLPEDAEQVLIPSVAIADDEDSLLFGLSLSFFAGRLLLQLLPVASPPRREFPVALLHGAEQPSHLAKRLPPVRDPVLFLGTQLRRCLPVLRKVEDRIIAKAIPSRRLLGDQAREAPLRVEDPPVRKGSADITAEMCAPVLSLYILELLQNPPVLLLIAAVFAQESGGIDPRRPPEIIDAEPGIIREDHVLLSEKSVLPHIFPDANRLCLCILREALSILLRIKVDAEI